MKIWKRRLTALLLTLVLLGGLWSGLLVGWHSGYIMGRPTGQLPHLVLQADGGIKLTFGTKGWQLTHERVREAFGWLAGKEVLVPRSLRMAALGGLAALFAIQHNRRPAAGKKLLAGHFAAGKRADFC